jgi:hypothetical protein
MALSIENAKSHIQIDIRRVRSKDRWEKLPHGLLSAERTIMVANFESRAPGIALQDATGGPCGPSDSDHLTSTLSFSVSSSPPLHNQDPTEVLIRCSETKKRK